MGTVSQELIDRLLAELKAGDYSAADTLWDLAEHMTPEQRADTETRVHQIVDD
jgi:hypothetical protein